MEHRDGVWRQNTDPFVFGERFHYTGCLRHTRRGPTQLRYLAPGSLVLFGSCRDKSGADFEHAWRRRRIASEDGRMESVLLMSARRHPTTLSAECLHFRHFRRASRT